MARTVRKILKKRDKDLRARWEELTKEHINGKPKYRYEAKLEMLASEFYISTDRIAHILFRK